MKIDSIKVEGRHRHDLGDIAGLAASMDTVGLLQPVVVTTDRRLVAGERRLAAARSLGWAEVKVHVVDSLDDAAALLRAERDENTCRKDFTPTEEHALYEALLALERPKAKERQTSGKAFPEVSARAKEMAGQAAAAPRDYNHGPAKGRYKTLDKVGHVKQLAADDTAPEPVREIAKQALAEMDVTGRVDGSYQRVKDAEESAARPTPSPAVGEWVEGAQSVQDAKYMHSAIKALCRADDLFRLDAERVGQLASDDDMTSLEHFARQATEFVERARRARSGLRLVNGGRQ